MACIAVQASAGVIPKFKFGVKAGLDYQSNNFNDRIKDLDFESSTGWFAGVQGDLTWAGFGIHPEILFSHNAFDVAGDAGKVKLNKVDIPILLQYRLLGVLALQAGPTFCVMTNTDGNFGGVEWDFKRPTIGYAVGPRYASGSWVYRPVTTAHSSAARCWVTQRVRTRSIRSSWV